MTSLEIWTKPTILPGTPGAFRSYQANTMEPNELWAHSYRIDFGTDHPLAYTGDPVLVTFEDTGGLRPIRATIAGLDRPLELTYDTVYFISGDEYDYYMLVF